MAQVKTNSKKPEELLKIMKAEAMGDKVFSHILEFMKVGMTEKQVDEEITKTFEKLGSTGWAFPTIVVSGARGALPHGEPTDKVIEDGDFVTIDMGGMVDGYCGDMTRTVAMGHATEEMIRVYNVVLDSQLAGLAALEVGVTCGAVDEASRRVIEEAGFGEYYIHSTGHGVGTEVHEPPFLRKDSEEELENDTAVTIEPGIYLPDRFGVRIEDLAIVTDFGIINAVKSPKELIIL